MRTLPELQYESSDVEDGALYVLVSPKEFSERGRHGTKLYGTILHHERRR